MVPVEVMTALAGAPRAGEWDAIVPLLTVDTAGFPNVCLLSRSELEADERHVYAVVAGSTTIDNLERTGRATLSIVTEDAAFHVKLEVAATTRDGDRLGLVLVSVSTKRDAVGVPVAPARYLATAELAHAETWEQSRHLLDILRKGAGDARAQQPA